METNKINENEVCDILGTTLPEINGELEKMSCSNAYKSLECLAKFTKRCAEAGDLEKLKKCFSVAETLLNKGNGIVKSAVENVYIFSISTLIEIVSPLQNQVNQMFTGKLKIAYQKQVMANYP